MTKDNELRTPEEWSDIDEVLVHDADGWAQSFVLNGVAYPAKPWWVRISREEWNARKAVSTISTNFRWRK